MSQTPDFVRAGVIGLNFGKAHVNSYLASPNCRLTALCDINKPLVDAAAREFGVEHTFTSAEELIKSGTVDLVSLCVPNVLHAPLTHLALENGLHVLVEKPMAMNTVEAQRMIAAAERGGRRLAIHFNHRMNSYVQAMRRYVESGDLGDIYFARTYWHRRRGIPNRPGFISKLQSGGGAMIDLGVHQLDQLLFLLGHPEIQSLSAQVYTKFDKLDVPAMTMDVDDFSVAFVRCANGVTMEMEISWASHHDVDENRLIQLYGTEGGARRYLVGYQGGPQDLAIFRRRHGALTEEHVTSPPDMGTVQSDLVDAIRTGRDPLVRPEHGLVTMQILDALYESSRTGREVLFDEMFRGKLPTEKHAATPA